MVCLIVIPTASAAPKAINAKIPIHIEVDHPNKIRRKNKYGQGTKLKTVKLNDMPKYITNNLEKYKSWLDI